MLSCVSVRKQLYVSVSCSEATMKRCLQSIWMCYQLWFYSVLSFCTTLIKHITVVKTDSMQADSQIWSKYDFGLRHIGTSVNEDYYSWALKMNPYTSMIICMRLTHSIFWSVITVRLLFTSNFKTSCDCRTHVCHQIENKRFLYIWINTFVHVGTVSYIVLCFPK